MKLAEKGRYAPPPELDSAAQRVAEAVAKWPGVSWRGCAQNVSLRGMRGILVWVGLPIWVACGNASSDSRSASAGGAGTASASELGAEVVARCPDGSEPSGSEPTGCPLALPAAGSCCREPGTACFYPGDETYRNVARCVDDTQHPAYWQQTLVIDRTACDVVGKLSELSDAPSACLAREVMACNPQSWSTPQELLGGQIGELLDACGGLPNESVLQVNFSQGCATQIIDGIAGPDHSVLLSCLGQALARVRFACADGLQCGRAERSTLK